MAPIVPDVSTVVEVNPGVLLGDIEGEAVALNMASDAYLHLNSSGTFAFGQIDTAGSMSVGQLCQALRREYAVDEEICRKEVGEFLARCLELGLLRVIGNDK